MDSSSVLDSELEFFRQQWLSEVRIKKGDVSSRQPQRRPSDGPEPPPTSPPALAAPRARPSRPAPVIDKQDHVLPDLNSVQDPGAPSGNADDGSVRLSSGKDSVSALDHFEEAMEKEAEGNMGESLKLYRRAYRLDNRVDRRYREKYFPSAPKLAAPQAASQPPDARQAPSIDHDVPVALPLPTDDLIASFSNLQIEAPPSEVDGAPPPPCPISTLPREILIHIMQDVAYHDVGDFARLSVVCKPFAYLVATEQRTWRQVSLSTKFGFTAMHFHWNKTVEWVDIMREDAQWQDGTLLSVGQVAERRLAQNILTSKSLVPDPYPDWKQMFRTRPRIRFNGCYISTVNYVRTGQASTNQATWGGSPIHIVTYYRYLRFFRDGTAISLLTTAEPSAVVHHLTRDMLDLHRDNPHANLPSAVVQRAFKARWRLFSIHMDWKRDDGPDHRQLQDGDVTVETESHDPKYMFRMDLSLRTAGKAARNNKLVWRSHFSYNKLTDDWAEFTLKHDKAFFFSRVKSYGTGE
ncbi:uncharacterized protein UV8b_01151 [Ustilaginoidea virens]|uniref:F-box domain-containing protein n=1 Tax=Ustilaginoidea virens TaxID=1159556 RepID=A0A063C6D4_USTVR|nr:uncharacterized protein UV8b_01151 [Ustilaginoidea virens]QUC16910.1 hypothetical protein UV8b_01151 [Ustilaginoidea virens]GAO19018.1 hypothetical protein UVI_02036310 [Ustilaginoidea virens]